MIRGYGFLAVLVLLANGVNHPCRADEAKPSAGKPIQQLIKQLGSPKYQERDQATRLLEKLEAKALDELRRAARAKDPEVSKRATLLVQKIEKKLETELTLAPTKVHLVCKDTPVKEAVAELARLSGVQIQIAGDQTRLAGRKVTLDTGETTFWQAFDQLCRKANLHEPPVITGPPSVEYHLLVREFEKRGSYDYSPLPASKPITVQEGTPAALPTCYLGALRVQARPATKLPGTRVPPGAPAFDLVVSPEPRLHWYTVLELRPTKLIDAKGKPLAEETAVELNPRAGGPEEQAMEELLLRDLEMSGYQARRPRTKQHTSWALKLGDAKQTVLKELAGQLVAKVETPPKALATFDNVLKAAGTTQKTDGGSVKLVSIAPHLESGLRMHVRLETPITNIPNAGAPAAAQGLVRRVLQVRGNLHLVYLTAEQAARGPNNFTLVDVKGKSFLQEKAVAVGGSTLNEKGDAEVREYLLTFMPNKGQARPERLVFNATRTINVQVPFVLKNVKVPPGTP
jgi:hypothetical protein